MPYNKAIYSNVRNILQYIQYQMNTMGLKISVVEAIICY